MCRCPRGWWSPGRPQLSSSRTPFPACLYILGSFPQNSWRRYAREVGSSARAAARVWLSIRAGAARGRGGLCCRPASQLADPSLRNAQQHGGIADRKLRGEAPQELGGVAGDLSGGALLLAAAGAQPAGPLVKHRVAGVVVHLQVQGRLSAARKILDHADDLADVAVEGPQGLGPGMRAGQRGYVGHPPVAVTGHHDLICHRPFSHPFPNTGSRSRSIARKVPGRTSPTCWATVVRAVTSVPSARVARASYWRWEPRWRSRTPPLRSMSLITSLTVTSIV